MQPVHFFFNNVSFILKNRKALKEHIREIFKERGYQLQSLNYIFCTDSYLQLINKQYLNHDDLTDIITFDLSETQNTIGEIYISIDRVKENAANLRESFNKELHRVMFHGVLHLTGQGDKTANEARQMRDLENHHLACYFRNVPRETK